MIDIRTEASKNSVHIFNENGFMKYHVSLDDWNAFMGFACTTIQIMAPKGLVKSVLYS